MNYSRTAIWRIRDIRASSLVELMLICAVVTILVTRAYLALTGYPQVGGATLHIAHMLWGGLLMLISALILFQAADRIWKHTVAIIFGVGFGLFIDEIGKFVTKDNDYFFKPAVAIMYVIFVLILLSTRLIARIDKRPPEEYLYFATELLARSFVGPITKIERAAALRDIKKSGITSKEVTVLTNAIKNIHISDIEEKPSWQSWDAFWLKCQEFLASKRAEHIIFAVIILHAVSYVGIVLVLRNQTIPQTFTEWLNALWQAVTGVLLLSGIVAWFRKKRTTALKFFYYGMLVMLLLGQVFIFASDQFYGLFELSINVAILASLKIAMKSQQQSKLFKQLS